MKQGITIFTDGSSRGNPGPGGWGAILIFSEGKNETNDELRITNGEVFELGAGEKKTTNNRMELTAVIEALRFVSQKSDIHNSSFAIRIYTDSSYVLNGATKWMHGWKKNNWRTATKDPVLNQDLWEELASLLESEPRSHLGTKSAEVRPRLQIEWKLAKGHAGIAGNERCDVIATSFADGEKPKLYSGSVNDYSVSLLVAPTSKAKSNKLKPKSSAKAYSYVSSVNGVVKTHATWAECEKRVKGVSGTKFKKSFSAEDEKAIIASWKASR